jgi:FtsZ-binding cell division protein ZapB
MKQEIESWLSSEPKDYQKGVALLDAVHYNKYMIKFISRGQTVANLDRIIYHLSNYVGKPYVSLMQIETKPFRKTEVTKTEIKRPSVTVSEISDVPNELLDRKRDLFSKRNQLSQAVQDQTKDKTDLSDEDKHLVKELLAYDEKIKGIDSQIEYWRKYGKMPDQVKEEIPENKELDVKNTDQQAEEVTKLKKLIKNQMTYITKAKAKFDKNPENLRLAEDLEKKRMELKRLTLLKEEIQSLSF